MSLTLWQRRLILFFSSVFGLLLLRFFFLVYNAPSPAPPAADIFLAFLGGLRFDLATVPLILLPGFLIAIFGLILAWIVPSKSRNFRSSILDWTFRIELGFHLVYGAFLVGLGLSSVYNYRFNGRHLGWEFSAYMSDLPMLARSSLDQSLFFSLFLILLVVVFLILAFWLPARIKARKDLSVGRELFHLFIWLLIFLILGRGGFQTSPIRTADALQTGNAYLDQLSLNGLFTVSRDLSDRDQFRPVVERDVAVSVVRSLLDERDAFLSSDYPLLRFMQPREIGRPDFSTIPVQSARPDTNRLPDANTSPGQENPPNIVLLILESGSASLLSRNGGDPGILPFLNDLVNRSVYFDRFYASGGRSANGIFSMFAGLPDRAGRTILRSSQIQNRFGGLARLLKGNGYRTSFYHGGDAAFDNLDRVLPELGFDVVYGQDSLSRVIEEKPTSTIGFDDQQVLKAFEQHLRDQSEKNGPFFAAYFSQSTHHPFSIPADFETMLSKQADTAQLNGFFAAAHFMDQSLKRFFEELEASSFFNNTVFIIVADHSHHAGLNYLQDRHIPLFIYAPGYWKPQIRKDIASQLDLLPTILAISGGNQIYASMGRDLSRSFKGNNGKPFAFFAGGSDTDIIGWVESDRILFKHFFIEQGVLLPTIAPLNTENLANIESKLYEDYLKKAQIFYQLARTLEKENSIWPDSVQLENIYRSVKTR